MTSDGHGTACRYSALWTWPVLGTELHLDTVFYATLTMTIYFYWTRSTELWDEGHSWTNVWAELTGERFTCFFLQANICIYSDIKPLIIQWSMAMMVCRLTFVFVALRSDIPLFRKYVRNHILDLLIRSARLKCFSKPFVNLLHLPHVPHWLLKWTS